MRACSPWVVCSRMGLLASGWLMEAREWASAVGSVQEGRPSWTSKPICGIPRMTTGELWKWLNGFGIPRCYRPRLPAG